MQILKFRSFIKITTLLLTVGLVGCDNKTENKDTQIVVKDTVKAPIKDTLVPDVKEVTIPKLNDTLNELANLISGNKEYGFSTFKKFSNENSFVNFSNDFTKRWNKFDSTRLKVIKNFAETTLINELAKTEHLFYPFSGPDILYASTLFPDIKHFTLIGLEPVGTLPIIDDKAIVPDSISKYFKKINGSLNAILNFSFFRTVAMKEDLRNDEVDGTLHLILLFLNKTANSIISVKPFYIDTLGNQQYLSDFNVLKAKGVKNKSLEINYLTKTNETKTITYTSTDLSDGAFKKNTGLNRYLNALTFNITYLKGASYLLHKTNFNAIRNLILQHTGQVVQDDSGIALTYFEKDNNKWSYSFYGKYTKPINMFKQHYQEDLDSLYSKVGTKKLGFGLGYNYRDKNSNFMVITKTAR